MYEVSVSTIVASLGVLLGALAGGTARAAQFCTLGAIADAYVMSDLRRMRAWLLAIATAILATQSLHLGGAIDLADSIYLTPDFGWLGAIVGGLCFGFGAAIAGTCGFGTLVRVGNGDLRALVVFFVIGFFGYMTMRGLTGVGREMLIDPTNADLSALGGQGLVGLVAWMSGLDLTYVRIALVTAIVIGLLWYCFKDRRFRGSPADVAAGLVIGLAVAAGWYVTGVIGNDEFEPAPLASLTFVRPLGESLVYLMVFSGATVNFGIGTVAGVVIGSFAAAKAKREFRFEAFDDSSEMLRHMAGGALMGIGGVMALGCTIGQAVTGMSTLALSAPIVFGAIVVGACLGLRYLEEGSLVAAVKLVFTKG